MSAIDVFISYTHRDNRTRTDERQGWIDRFQESLRLRLDALCGRDTHVWRDEKIEGTDLLTPTIAEAVTGAAVLVSVISPSYLNSEWCAKELALFLEAAAARSRVGTKSRIVKVFKTPVDRAAFAAQAELHESIGYEFYTVDPRGAPKEFDPQLGEHPFQQFLNAVNDVAYGIWRLLPSEGASRPASAPDGKTVYLAGSSFDLAPSVESLRRELVQFGHTVVPESPIAFDPQYGDRVRDLLARCDLSIHPAGAGYALIPEGADRSIAEIQYTLAGEEAARRTAFVRVPWTPPGVDRNDPRLDPRQAAFLTALNDDERLLVMPVERFKTSIRELVEEPTVKAAPPRTETTGFHPSVYVVADAADLEAVAALEDDLFARGFEVTRSLTKGDESELRLDHQENLNLCDAVLVYYGVPGEFWLRSKLLDLRKAFGYGRTRPFDARAVVLADPQRADKERFRSRELLALNAYGPYEPAMLDSFLEHIRASRNEAV